MNSLESMSQALCPFFGRCGGCQYQDIPYEDELALKEEDLKKLFHEQVPSLDDIFLPIVPSPKSYRYRNRLDLKLKKLKDGSVPIGFSPVEPGVLVQVDQCPIAMPSISEAIGRIKKEALAILKPKYREANLTMRCGDDGIVRWGGIGKGSTKLAPEDYFVTELKGLKFAYSLDSFFQANLSILPDLIETIRALPFWSPSVRFFDLYGGVGLFSLSVHDVVRETINIESNIHAVKIARHNIELNQIVNAQALDGRVEDVLPKLLEEDMTAENVVMVDPPRGGLSPKSVTLLNGLERASHLIYLSCGPKTLVDNVVDLAKGGWRVDSIQPFDLFPRTRHLETLVVLSR